DQIILRGGFGLSFNNDNNEQLALLHALELNGDKRIALNCDGLSIQSKSDQCNISTNGVLTSTSHITLSPNDDPLLVLLQSGDIYFHHEEISKRDPGSLFVNCRDNTFKNITTFKEDCIVQGTCSVSSGHLSLGSNAHVMNTGDELTFAFSERLITLSKDGTLS